MIIDKTEFRPAIPEDRLGILALQRRAFGRDAEAELVDRLIEGPDRTISMVADLDGMIVGHILLTELRGPEGALALAPLGVDPDWRDFLIGTELTNCALASARDQGWMSVFVLGDPVYYGRFGFKAELTREMDAPWSGPGFMALELVPRALEGYRGTVVYPETFLES